MGAFIDARDIQTKVNKSFIRVTMESQKETLNFCEGMIISDFFVFTLFELKRNITCKTLFLIQFLLCFFQKSLESQAGV